MIERDLRLLEQAIGLYQRKYRAYPKVLTKLVSAGYLPQIPEEPFGGFYLMDSQTGQVTSSTHPTRLKVFRRDLESGM
jgi:hypothetical protein